MCYGHEQNVHNRVGSMPFFSFGMASMMKDILSHMKHHIKDIKNWIPYYFEEYLENYMLIIPLPGFAKKDIQINLIGNTINIKAKKKEKSVEENKIPEEKQNIFPGNQFIRQIFKHLWEKGIDMDIALPSDINKSEIKSKMVNGLLKIKLDKKEQEKINIDIENNN
jgi:HSP20 family molecular chaperone IbpA